MQYVMALDQGTSSSRSLIVDQDGQIVASAQQEFRQIFPQPGWVEHDPVEIWQSQLATCQRALQQAGLQASQQARDDPLVDRHHPGPRPRRRRCEHR